MTSIVINGNPYSDDGSTVNDMQRYGYLTHLLPMIGDVATVAGEVQANAAQVAIDAAIASDATAAMKGTSTTSLSVAAGNITLTTQAGKQFTAGNYVTISRISVPTTLMHGVVTSYSGTTLEVSVSTVGGAGGPFTDWNIAISGAKGNDGATGNGQMAYLPKSGAYTVTAEDKGSIIDCTGAFTLSFQSCGTLGNKWTTYVRNGGTGTITLEPDGSETINGSATYTLNAGSTVMLSCDGAVLRCVFAVLNELVRLPIFSSQTLTAKPASVLEDVFDSYPDTLLAGKSASTVLFGASLFVASTYASSGNVSTSPDGVTWTLRAMPSAASWMVGTDGSSFVASVSSSTATARSTNGTTWTAATALPGNCKGVAPMINGGVSLILASVESTFYRSVNYGASAWTTQKTPTIIGSIVTNVGGLFWYHYSGTTAYTSATGLTGSWTARTLPVTLVSDACIDSDGDLWISGAGTNAFKTTDGINWTDEGPLLDGRLFLRINGIDLYASSTFGNSVTRAAGLTTVRKSLLTQGIGISHRAVAKSGNILVFNSTETDGKVGRIDSSAPAATALFTR